MGRKPVTEAYYAKQVLLHRPVAERLIVEHLTAWGYASTSALRRFVTLKRSPCIAGLIAPTEEGR